VLGVLGWPSGTTFPASEPRQGISCCGYAAVSFGGKANSDTIAQAAQIIVRLFSSCWFHESHFLHFIRQSFRMIRAAYSCDSNEPIPF
jgi:hypothetical protein